MKRFLMSLVVGTMMMCSIAMAAGRSFTITFSDGTTDIVEQGSMTDAQFDDYMNSTRQSVDGVITENSKSISNMATVMGGPSGTTAEMNQVGFAGESGLDFVGKYMVGYFENEHYYPYCDDDEAGERFSTLNEAIEHGNELFNKGKVKEYIILQDGGDHYIPLKETYFTKQSIINSNVNSSINTTGTSQTINTVINQMGPGIGLSNIGNNIVNGVNTMPTPTYNTNINYQDTTTYEMTSAGSVITSFATSDVVKWIKYNIIKRYPNTKIVNMKRLDSTHIIIRLQDSVTKRYNGDFEMEMLPIGFSGKDVTGMPSLKDGMWYCSAYGKDTYKQYIGFVMIRRIKRDPKWNDLKWSINLIALNNDKTRDFPEIVKKGGSYDTPSSSSWLEDNFTS